MGTNIVIGTMNSVLNWNISIVDHSCCRHCQILRNIFYLEFFFSSTNNWNMDKPKRKLHEIKTKTVLAHNNWIYNLSTPINSETCWLQPTENFFDKWSIKISSRHSVIAQRKKTDRIRSNVKKCAGKRRWTNTSMQCNGNLQSTVSTVRMHDKLRLSDIITVWQDIILKNKYRYRPPHTNIRFGYENLWK